MFGFTDNYIKIALPWDERLVGTLQNVRIGTRYAEGAGDGTIER